MQWQKRIQGINLSFESLENPDRNEILCRLGLQLHSPAKQKSESKRRRPDISAETHKE